MKRYILSIIIVSALCGCGGGTAASAQSGGAGLEDGDIPAQIKSIDDYSLNYSINPSAIPNDSSAVCNENICATLVSLPHASYAAGISAINYWIMKDVPGQIRIDFKSNNTSGLAVTDIQQSLSTVGNPVGLITQLDMSNCERSSKAIATSCTVDFYYTGNATNEHSDSVTFKLSETTSGVTKALDIPVTVSNKYAANQTLAILNTDNADIMYFTNPPSENNTSSDIIHSFNYTNPTYILNMGSVALSNPDSSKATATISASQRFSSDPVTLIADDILYTSCENRNISAGGRAGNTCTFGFVNSIVSSGTLSSLKTRFILSYINLFGPANYAQRSVINVGDFAPIYNARVFNNKESNSFYIHKAPLQGNGLVYSIPDSSFKLQIRYEPNFYIGHTTLESASALSYNVGTFSYAGQKMNISDVINNHIQLTYDSACFESAKNDADSIVNGGKCAVGITLDNPDAYTDSKGLTFQLYALYISGVDGKSIEQYLGNVTFVRPLSK